MHGKGNEMKTKKEFFAKFGFDPAKAGFLGVEREQFVIDKETRRIVPLSFLYLDEITRCKQHDPTRMDFGYELSACQVESKIGPCILEELWDWLHDCESVLKIFDKKLLVERVNWELAPEDMPLDIYPDPTGRYQMITRDMPREVLSAACRVAATHIHVGMPDLLTAISAYNRVIQEVDALTKLGDNSSGKRIALYRTMAKRHHPELIKNPDDFYDQAVFHGFVDDPRKCWTIIRISVHGTIEFRMFGATDSIDQIVDWAERCRSLCFD